VLAVTAGLIPLVALAFPTVAEPPSADQDDFALLQDTQQVFRDVSAALRPYLVRIDTVGGAQPTAPQPLPEGDEDAPTPRRRSQTPFQDTPGSSFVLADGPTTGIIYSSDGYILTSSFNFVREPVLVTVTLPDGRRLAADLVARDQVRKVALLKTDATNLAVPPWADEIDVRVGQWAVALGLGFGGDTPSITVGMVSALDRMQTGAIQTDAKLSPANYGGPLCDIHGRIIGLGVPMAQRRGELAGVEMYDSGVGFAVPRHRVDEIAAVLKTGRSFYRGWLGIVIEPLVRDAVVIRNVAIPSPVHEAGISPGDRIVQANGEPLRHFGDLVRVLYMLPAGEEVLLKMERDGAEFSAVVTLARNTELGPLPELEEPFDPSSPLPTPEDD
jgi:serine protease Do